MEKDHQQLWEECRRIIKDHIPPAQYDTWFRDITSLSFDGSSLTLSVPSAIFLEQLEERYRELLVPAIRKVYGRVTLSYYYNNVKDDPQSAVKIRSSEPSVVILNGTSPKTGGRNQEEDVNPHLNARYNFENYCSGASNRLAWGIGQSIANDPTIKTYNPLFIFGATGVGKTHLIQAIGIRIKERDPRTKVLYVTAREFQSQYTAAETSGNTNGFFHFYQSIDTLIIDDIQDLRGKPKTQNTFYHIFNHLHQNGRQIIMSSDCSPADMEGFEERLLSRFRWGMNAHLDTPDLELRRNVLHRKAEQDGLELPEDVVDYIAANITDSIRELEGIVVSLVGRAAVLNVDISLELARSVVATPVRTHRRQVNCEMVTAAVCEYYGVDSDHIFTKSRKREISDARQVIMYLAKKIMRMPFTTIGVRLGRTHATVMYSCKNIEERLPLEKQLSDDLAAIEAMLSQ